MVKVLAFAALVAAVPAQASNWVPAAKATDGTIVFYDADSIVRSGSNVTLWIEYNFANVKSEPARTAKHHVIFFCDAQEMQITYAVSYTAAGTVMNSAGSGFEARHPLIPDSLAEIVSRQICPKAP